MQRTRGGHHLTRPPRAFTIVGIEVRKKAIEQFYYIKNLENLCGLACVALNSKIVEIIVGTAALQLCWSRDTVM
jgi:hypothetical protein